MRHFGAYVRGEGLETAQEMLARPEYRAGMHMLKDYSDIQMPTDYSFDFARSQALAFTELDATESSGCRIALVSSQPASFGKLRQLTALMDASPADRRAFASLDAAAQWLELPSGYVVRFVD